VEERSAIIWRHLPLRLALVAIPGWLTLAVLLFNVGWRLKTLVGFELLLAIASPVAGLVIATALMPFGQLLAITISAQNFRVTEAIVLAFFAGWLLRGWADHRGPEVPGPVGWPLVALVAASITGLAVRLGHYPGELASTADVLIHLYNFADDRVGFTAGARLLEGLALAAATVTLFRRRPRLAVVLPAALAVTGCLTAFASILLWRGIAPAAVLRQHALNGYRVSAPVADANAAGSYFSMLIFLALGMSMRARGLQRATWLAVSAVTAIGLWFSESRSAIGVAATAFALLAVWLVSIRLPRHWRAAVLFAALAGATVIGASQARRIASDPLGFRREFNATSLRMMAAHPIFGVGVGQYYRTSTLFLTPRLAWIYGAENAHNNFFQVGAELGLAGLALFAAWLGIGLGRGVRALSIEPADLRLLGVWTGVVAFLATCLSGHPLLIDEVADPFWIQFGLLLGLAGSTVQNEHVAPDPRLPRAAQQWWVGAATAVGVCLSLAAWTSPSARDIGPPQSHAIDGFFGWETGTDGVRYRWTGRYASVFVPSDVTRVYIPVRMPAKVATLLPAEVDASIGGVVRSRTLVGDFWAIINLDLPRAEPPAPFTRVNLRIERTWQPALYIPSSSDFRVLGVQVGETRFFRER
jgi:O-antigen ligase